MPATSSRSAMRNAIQGWLDPTATGDWANDTSGLAPDIPDGLDRCYRSFPKRIDFKQVSRLRSSATHAVMVVFLKEDNDRVRTIGGEHSGYRRRDYLVFVQVYIESKNRSEDQQVDDVDEICDAIHDRIVQDHRFGQDPSVIWEVAESTTGGGPTLQTIFGEPLLNKGGAVEQWVQFVFTATQWFQA